MNIGKNLLPEFQEGIDLCSICRKRTSCSWLDELVLLINRDNPKGELLVTECGMFQAMPEHFRAEEILTIQELFDVYDSVNAEPKPEKPYDDQELLE